MYVCMHEGMNECMYVFMYGWTYVRTLRPQAHIRYVHIFVCAYVHTYIQTDIHTYICTLCTYIVDG